MNPWSVFWQQGHSTTFGNYLGNGYDGPIGEWWQGILKSDVPRNGTVLELGCGNCSLVPGIASVDHVAKYIGVDIARVEVSAVARQALKDNPIELVIHSETPAEDLPEADASVDLVASIFGIEYSNLEQSLPEAYRVLKPGSKLCLLVHHHGSVVTNMTKRALSEFEWADIDAAIDALETINSALQRLGNKGLLKSDQTAEGARLKINALAEKYLSTTDLKTANAIMFEFMNSVLGFFKLLDRPNEERAAFIPALKQEYVAYEERLKQMAGVTRDDEGIEALMKDLANAGFKQPTLGVVESDGNIVAWQLCAEK